MDGLVAGIVDDTNIAGELLEKLQNEGYYSDHVSVISGENPASSGPLGGIVVADVPETLMSYGASEQAANNYYEEIEEEYVFIAVLTKDSDANFVKNIFSEYEAKDVQFFAK